MAIQTKDEFLRALTDAGVESAQAQGIADAFFAEGGIVDQMGKATSNATTALGKYATALDQSRDSFSNFAGAFKAGIGALGDLSGAVGQVLGKLPGLGTLFSSIGNAANIGFQIAGVAVAEFADVITKNLGRIDEFTRFHRELDKANFDLAKSFGGSFREAKGYTDQFIENMATYSGIDYGFLSKEDLAASIKTFENLNISADQVFSTVRLGSRDMDLYAAAVLQAGAMNMETYQYLSKLNDMMAKQGMTAQQAVEQMAMFSDVAEKTGLNVETVSRTLIGAANNFAKLGMTADFGRPLLQGLTNTLEDMGLGIENATGLTDDLSSALGRLTTDYATAYITQQRSGLDFGGGGGVLGASIGLQAQMLQADQTGDQAGMAQMLTGAMRDTLASFTGGDIVTVQEAAEDPSKQMAFYAQQQLLQSQYGISDPQSATRVLDYLDRLETARATGDDDVAKKLEEQIQEEIEGRDKTVGELEKLNVQFNALLAYARLDTRNLTVVAQGIGAGMRMGTMEGARAGTREIMSRLDTLDELAERAIDNGTLGAGQNLLSDPSQILNLMRDDFSMDDLQGQDFDESGRERRSTNALREGRGGREPLRIMQTIRLVDSNDRDIIPPVDSNLEFPAG